MQIADLGNGQPVKIARQTGDRQNEAANAKLLELAHGNRGQTKVEQRWRRGEGDSEKLPPTQCSARIRGSRITEAPSAPDESEHREDRQKRDCQQQEKWQESHVPDENVCECELREQGGRFCMSKALGQQPDQSR